MAFINYGSKELIKICDRIINDKINEIDRQNKIVDKIAESDDPLELLKSDLEVFGLFVKNGYMANVDHGKEAEIRHLRGQIKDLCNKRAFRASELKEIAEVSLMAESDGFIYLSEEDVRFIKPYL